MSVDLKLIQENFPKGKPFERDGKVKVHLEGLNTEDISKLYMISEINHTTGESAVNIDVKRSGTGLTVVFEKGTL